jgi:hypothetical protein
MQIVVDQHHRAARAERDAEHAAVRPPQCAERPLRVSLAGERGRQRLRNDGDRHLRQQRGRMIGDAIEIAGDDRSGAPRDPRRRDRGIGIDVVHVQELGALDHLARQFGRAQGEPRVPLP